MRTFILAAAMLVIAAPMASAQEVVPLDSPTAASVNDFLKRFRATVQDGSSVAGLFDYDRMLSEFGVLGGAKAAELAKDAAFRRQTTTSLSARMDGQTQNWAWSRHQLRKVTKRADGVLVAIVRQWDAEGQASMARWWLHGSGTGLRVFDMESVEVGVRVTTGMAMGVLAMMPNADPRVPSGFKQVTAAVAKMNEGDLQGAAELCDSVPAGVIPDGFEGMRLMILSAAAGEREDPEGMLRYIAQARRLNLDLPMLHFLEASGLVGTDQSALGEASARRYIDAVGATPDGYWLLGLALSGQEKEPAAIQAFRTGLDDDPSSSDCLGELIARLPDGAAEVATRFAKMPSPEAEFEVMIATVLQASLYKSAEGLIAVLRRVSPGDTNAEYYTARILMDRDGKPTEAAALLDGALSRAPDEEVDAYISIYCEAMAKAGESVAAYRRVGDKDVAFDELANYLSDAGQGVELAALCDLHAQTAPKSPMVPVWRAEALALQGKHAEALTMAAAGLKSSDEGVFGNAARRSVLSNIVLKRFDEALRVAKLSTAADQDPWWELVVAAAKGDAAEAGRLMQALAGEGLDPDVFWHEDHIAKALESNPAFAELKKQYPHQAH